LSTETTCSLLGRLSHSIGLPTQIADPFSSTADQLTRLSTFPHARGYRLKPLDGHAGLLILLGQQCM